MRSLRAEFGGRPICLYGQSYGAYLALLVAPAVRRLLHAVAVWAPVTDLPHLLATSSGVRRQWLEEELGALRTDPGRLALRSPISHVSELAGTQLLIGHGRLDDRCPVEQSRRLVRLLSARPPDEGSVRYLEEADSPHTPATWRRWTGAVTAHFGRVNAPLAWAGDGAR